MKTKAMVVVFLFAALAVFLLVPPRPVQGVSSNIVIGEFRVRGPNGGSDEFIELYNLSTSPVNIGGWKVRGSNAAGTVSTRATIPAGTILDSGCHYLLTNSSTSGGPYSGSVPGDQTYATGITDDGGIAVTLPNDVVVDAVGLSAGSAFKEGAPLASLGTPNLNRSYERKPGGSAGSGTDTDNNANDFVLRAPSDPQNRLSPCIPVTITNPSGVGAANPDELAAGESTLLTVSVIPGANPTSTGLAVAADLASIGGAAVQAFFDNGTNGDATAGDNVFSFQATVVTATSAGVKVLPVTITDAQSRTGTTTITLGVGPLLAIHDIQGPGTASPFAGQFVRTSGIVTGRRSNGFFIQVPDGSEDGDANTSEGIFVFTGGAPPAAAVFGNLVRVAGTVQEFVPSADPNSPPLTEIINPASVKVMSSGNPLPAPISLTGADTSPVGSIEQLERFEGMRVRVDSLTVVGPTQGSISEANATATSNGVFFGVITGIDRPFREPGIEVPDPLPGGSPCCVPRFDGNPERLRVDSDAQPGAAALNVTSGAIVTNLTGPLDYAFRTYTVLPDPPPSTPPTFTGNVSAMPVPAPAMNEFTVASFNLQRFFDTTNDPLVSDAVLTAAAFNNRLNKASLAIRNVLQTPDILGVAEVENLATLQVLANKINDDAVAAGQPDPNYQAYLEEGNDPGGIDVGFLVKGSRVTVVDVTQEGKSDTFINPVNNLPEILNDRPPLVLRAIVQSAIGPNLPVTVIANHLRSLGGIDDPVDGARVRAKRRAQGEFLANLIQARQAADPNENIISIGDYNAFQFNDGYVDLVGTIKGTPTSADQVVLASGDLVDPDLTNLVDLLSADERYSFVFDGSAQVLDHVLVGQNLVGRVDQLHYARNGADFPETFRNDPNRPERVSDHDVPVAYFMLPPITVAIDIKPGSFPNSINLGSNGTVPVAILSTPEFDAGNVDPATVALASASVRLRGKGAPMASLEDVNGDGLLDLVVHVTTSALQLTESDTEAVLTGMTFDRKRIRGTDSVRVVP